jgi:putative spermidine/putrescine transport system permease protein
VKAVATDALPRRIGGWRGSVWHQAGWLVPLWGVALLLGMAILATAIMSLHPHREGIIVSNEWTIENYTRFLFDRYYLRVLATTTGVGIIVVLLTLVLGYAPAYLIARAEGQKGLMIALTISPIFVPSIIRAFSWTYVLSGSGLLNRMLGVFDLSLPVMYTPAATIIGLTHVLLPFMIISLLSAIEHIDETLEEAAVGLGASRWTVLRRIVFPLSLPGVAAGSLLVFTLTVASYITPATLGRRQDPVIAETIFDVFHGAGNWPFGSAIAVLVLLFVMVAIVVYMQLLQPSGPRAVG